MIAFENIKEATRFETSNAVPISAWAGRFPTWCMGTCTSVLDHLTWHDTNKVPVII